ncbi:S-layer homology domain-containing protein [Acetohalobium arabaticum]|uniref:S-layer domain protein n=1 Tax=Acetohalobium arabaticum (strain ATCC 49924 / DSM 5501 / Z-7288) TaxID=574087 RepID=D9QR33_ACEAZ|nr:S-layer homology domain-containing protein [Acetohalobium arabaticum]ADL12974.1 S-layer domain protein [Acetohalobium arabaticum DSM 5501]
MKKIVSIGLIVSLLLVFTLPVFGQEKIEDVPKDHWAYQSVKELVDRGFMSLHEDNTFNGQEEVTRYQLAKVVAEILATIDQGQVKGSKEDAATLRELSTEFRSELVEINKKTDIFDKKLDKLAKQDKVAEEDRIKTKEELMAVRKEVDKIITDIEEYEATQHSLKSRLTTLESKNRNLRNRVSVLEDELSETKDENEELKSKSKNQMLVGGGLLLLVLAAGS